jgi:predicted flavoprotein YhiN
MSFENQFNRTDDIAVGVVGGGRPSTDLVVGVVGGGPAGLMAAGMAASQGARVLLIEKNESCGRKLLITGSGKCNITNTLNLQDFLDGFFENKKFLYPALTRFSSSSLLEFFGKYGLSFITVDNFKIFPETERADTVLNALLTFCKNQGVEIISSSRVMKIEINESNVDLINTPTTTSTTSNSTNKNTEQSIKSATYTDTNSFRNNILSNTGKYIKIRKFKISTEGKEFYCDKLIIATGGLSYPITGSTGDGYSLARSFDHKIISTRPALAGIKTDNSLLSELSGVSLRDVKVTLVNSEHNTSVAVQTGDVLFTHTGLSGPCILNLSRYLSLAGTDFTPSSSNSGNHNHNSISGSKIQESQSLQDNHKSKSLQDNHKSKSLQDNPKSYSLQIDLFQNKSMESLDREIIEILSSNPKKELKTALSKSLGLPVSFAGVLIKLCGLNSEIPCSDVTKGQRKKLLQSIKSFSIPVTTSQGYDKAMVTAGGVATSEINPKTMESKLVSGLYFAGEIIDIDGITGGYNLQFAFSTGFLAGESAGRV